MGNTALDRTQPAGTRTRRSLTFYLRAVRKPHGYWAAAMTHSAFESPPHGVYWY